MFSLKKCGILVILLSISPWLKACLGSDLHGTKSVIKSPSSTIEVTNTPTKTIIPTKVSPDGSESEKFLFIETDKKGSYDESDPTIIRARFVELNLDAIVWKDDSQPSSVFADKVTLNLFPDVIYKAILDDVEKRNIANSFVWVGHIPEIEMNSVSLVVERGVMNGSIIFPDGVYEISHSGEDVYIIKEIDQSKFIEG